MNAPSADLTTPRPTTRLGAVGVRLRSDASLRDCVIALELLLVLVVGGGIAAYVALGPVSHAGFDPPGVVDHLGGIRDALAAPFARWDSVWYLTLARDGYAGGPDTAFFPLYPLLVAIVGALGPGLLVGGVLVSVACLFIALRMLWRLTELELGAECPDAPGLAVLALALGPMAFFFTAVYGESLYLALSLGAFLSARQGRWARAAGLGALAAATRSEGVLLVGALALLFLEQRRGAPLRLSTLLAALPLPTRRPRGVGASARAAATPLPTRRPPGVGASARGTWPRPRPRDALWLAAIPLGLGAYLGWLWLIGLDPVSPFSVQEVWYRHLRGPLGGALDGARAAFGGARQLLSGQTQTRYFAPAGGDPMIAAWHNLMLFAFLVGALFPLVGALRRLSLAYGAYALTGIVLAISYPVVPQPLTSLPRYLVVLFPLQMAGAVWMARHPRVRRPALTLSATTLVGCSALFATWHWIA